LAQAIRREGVVEFGLRLFTLFIKVRSRGGGNLTTSKRFRYKEAEGSVQGDLTLDLDSRARLVVYEWRGGGGWGVGVGVREKGMNEWGRERGGG